MVSFILVATLSVILVVLTTILFYEILRFVWTWLPNVSIAPRKRIILVMLAIFGAHTLAVWIYGVAYWILVKYTDLGVLGGNFEHYFFSYIYFSASTYSSLGFGDVYPHGALRLLAGVEVLNGLVLIGWSVSFTYLAMEKFWDMHPRRNKPSP